LSLSQLFLYDSYLFFTSHFSRKDIFFSIVRTVKIDEQPVFAVKQRFPEQEGAVPEIKYPATIRKTGTETAITATNMREILPGGCNRKVFTVKPRY
jgi:hypothetical protein